jgi:glycosyltransferase involved in cell wall biosynthesis
MAHDIYNSMFNLNFFTMMNRGIMKISIIIPLYNEADNLPLLYDKLTELLAEDQREYEVILVNDGSFDMTQSYIDDICKKDFKFKAIHLKRNFGQTAAMMAGIDAAMGDVIVPMDGDLQNDPKDIPRLVDKLEEGYDVVSGWRKNRKDNALIRTIPSKVANWLISKVSGVYLHDYGCTLKAYKKEVIKTVKLYGEMHRFIPIYSHWLGGKVAEIYVTHHHRVHGRSNYGIMRTFKVILDLMLIIFLSRYADKPIHLFGGFGLMSLSASFLSFSAMFYYKFWGGKSFVETPLPILAGLFLSVGIISILLGLIAEILNRTYHESQNRNVYITKDDI